MDRSFCDERKSCWLLRIYSKNLIPAALTACLVMYPGFNAPILAKHNCLLARNTTEASCQWPILFNTHKRNRKPKTRRRHRQENFLTVCSVVSQDMSVLFCVDLVFMATSSFQKRHPSQDSHIRVSYVRPKRRSIVRLGNLRDHHWYL